MTRGAKAAASESIFRDVNERVVEIDRAHGVPTDELASFLCECARTSCIERVALSTTDYERIRGHGTWFVVLPGHNEPDVERIVEQTESYVVVEKQGEAGEVAEQRDPRD